MTYSRNKASKPLNNLEYRVEKCETISRLNKHMKRIVKNVLCLSVLALLASCVGGNSALSNNNKSNTSGTSSQEGKSDTSYISSNTSQNKTSSKTNQTSSSVNSTSQKDYVDNELSTSSGLVVKFKATGASIDKITWGGKQIAKDGFVVGRCANRIANGKFSIDGTQYSVSVNSGSHSLHGGAGSGMNNWRGPFATKDWTKVNQTASSIKYKIVSPDGENGYPGEMTMEVTYTLSQAGELSIYYTATTTKDTLCNPTNHLFLAMNGNNSYSNIKLWINADNYTPLSDQIPTGAISPVAGTQFDYREEKAFDGSKNYDDNYVLNGTGSRKVATLTGSSLGVKVDVFTDRPGLQLYKDGSGNICLETQMFPDMINHPEFASYGTTVLRKGEKFESTTTYSFSQVS